MTDIPASAPTLTRVQEALFTVLNDEYDLAVDDFQKLWPSLEALLAGFGMTSTLIESYPEVS